MLRTVKLLALVAMFVLALSSSAQVTTSALSVVVTDENQALSASNTVLYTPSDAMCYAVTNMEGRNAIQEIHHQSNSGDGFTSEAFLLFIMMFSFLLSIVFSIILIIAVLKGENITIKISKFNIKIGHKKGKEE